MLLGGHVAPLAWRAKEQKCPFMTRQPPSPLAIRSIPTCAHAASLSPPGAPETPIAPTISWPAIIGSAPSAEVILSRCSAPAPVGFAVTRLPNSPEGVRNVREVYALRRLFSRVCGFAPSSCSTTTVRVARFSTVTVTLYPSLRHCSRAPIAASCAALNDRVRSVTSAGGVAAVCAWATGDTMARVAAKTSHLLLVMGSSSVVCKPTNSRRRWTMPAPVPWDSIQHFGMRCRLPMAAGCIPHSLRSAPVETMAYLSKGTGHRGDKVHSQLLRRSVLVGIWPSIHDT